MFLKNIRYKVNSIFLRLELRILHKRVKSHGCILEKQLPLLESQLVIENYFKTTLQKNALLSYIIYPFTAPILNNHSNHQECFAMAEILQDLGYNVDIINWDNESFIPSKKYDIVIDNHNNLARLSPYIINTKKIFHATNAHWLFQNLVEYGRYYEFYNRYGKAIKPPRLILPGNSAENCDAISMFGNEFTRETYGSYQNKIFHLPMSVNCKPELSEIKNYDKAKLKFVWLNSHGALLKGLDIVLDAFLKLPELELFVFADLEKDREFMDAIRLELSQPNNIRFLGWVDIEGNLFNEVVNQCAWIIGSSFSEGGGGSILNGMGKGLVPIISRSCSINLPAETGYYLEKNTREELFNIIQKLSKLPSSLVKKHSANAHEFISANHTIEKFKLKYKEFLVNQLIN